MIYYQSRITEEEGGHPISTLNTKFNALATQFGMSEVLETMAL